METQQQSGVRGGEEEAESVDGNTKDKSWKWRKEEMMEREKNQLKVKEGG